ncbi:helix-turn-helix domain-containing protein [Streptomyces olivaceus]|uniref:helix-turn-helix domain-containing protein n=1 Tax=Streptomyces olivaceus TaxID=47716 RepID=UPI0024925D67|nr:helix-turn-helix domain-containing protein [Streptomyces olivaceus]
MSEPEFDDLVGVGSSDAPPLFTMVPEWITYSGIKAAHRTLWTVLASCVNHDRPDNLAWPTQDEIADAMGLKKPEQLAPYRQALEGLGAIEVTEKRYQGGMRRRYIYDVRFRPPQGYTGPLSRQEWLQRRKARLAVAAEAEERDTAAFEQENAGQDGPPKNRGAGGPKNEGSGPAKNGGARAPSNGGAKQDQQQPDQQQPETAPSARSAGDGRRPSTGSSARRKSSGSAAGNGTDAPKKSPRSRREGLVTREVKIVLDAFPEALLEALTAKAGSGRPRTVIKAIEDQLAGGGITAKTLGQRVARRWVTHRYTEHYTAGTLTSPVGATLAMLKPGPCPDPRCEDGKFNDGSVCPSCIERDKDRAAAREQQQAVAAAEKEAAVRRRACPLCRIDRGTAGQVCGECTTSLASTEQAIAIFLDQAVSNHLALADPCGGQVEAADIRDQLVKQVDEARAWAASEGADALGEALAGRLTAERLVKAETLPTATEQTPEAPPLPTTADQPVPEPGVDIPAQGPRRRRDCPGPDNQGCPGSRLAVGLDGNGLCARCRVVAETRNRTTHH